MVERPLRLMTDLSQKNIERFEKTCEDSGEGPIAKAAKRVAGKLGPGPHKDFNAVMAAFEADADKNKLKLTATRNNLLKNELAKSDETAMPVVRKVYKPGKGEVNPLYGMFETKSGGKKSVVEYEADSELRDTEQVPLLENGGIEAFFKREVLPYVPDAWIDAGKTQIGYEISFTRYFYKLVQMRPLDEIMKDIKALEKESEGLLTEIIG